MLVNHPTANPTTTISHSKSRIVKRSMKCGSLLKYFASRFIGCLLPLRIESGTEASEDDRFTLAGCLLVGIGNVFSQVHKHDPPVSSVVPDSSCNRDVLAF